VQGLAGPQAPRYTLLNSTLGVKGESEDGERFATLLVMGD
jgi:hypothetical protein